MQEANCASNSSLAAEVGSRWSKRPLHGKRGGKNNNGRRVRRNRATSKKWLCSLNRLILGRYAVSSSLQCASVVEVVAWSRNDLPNKLGAQVEEGSRIMCWDGGESRMPAIELLLASTCNFKQLELGVRMGRGGAQGRRTSSSRRYSTVRAGACARGGRSGL